jgi:hypothetical protein
MITLANIHSERLDDTLRVTYTANLFGVHFPFKLEPTIYGMADRLAPAYNGGYWHFYGLSNGGFYMAPATDAIFDVSCENGFDGKLSADAFRASRPAVTHIAICRRTLVKASSHRGPAPGTTTC